VFQNVSFDYGDGRDVLRHVSFAVSPGQTMIFLLLVFITSLVVAVLGPSVAAQTLLAFLFPWVLGQRNCFI